MKPLSLLLFAVCLLLSGAAFARGGMGSHMSMSMTGGGALGTSAAAPGTNSLGTALPSSGIAGHVMKGPLLGTDPTIDKEDARLEKMLEGSICRGC
jgi:hypothetical protein